MPPALRRFKPGPSTLLTSTKLLPLVGLLLALSRLPPFAAGQRVTTPTPSPAAAGASGATPAPRGGGAGGGGGGGGGAAVGDDDDGGLSEVCDADGGSADYSEVLT